MELDYIALAQTASYFAVNGVIVVGSLLQRPLVLLLIVELLLAMLYFCIKPISYAAKVCSRVLDYLEGLAGYCTFLLGASIVVTIAVMLRDPLYSNVFSAAIFEMGSMMPKL